eukprot:scaffold652_cov100-Isochrysis_galbana.AAC.8
MAAMASAATGKLRPFASRYSLKAIIQHMTSLLVLPVEASNLAKTIGLAIRSSHVPRMGAQQPGREREKRERATRREAGKERGTLGHTPGLAEVVGIKEHVDACRVERLVRHPPHDGDDFGGVFVGSVELGVGVEVALERVVIWKELFRHRAQHTDHDHQENQPARPLLDEGVRESVLEEAGEAPLLRRVRVGAHGELRGGLKVGVGAQQVAATLAALALAPVAAGAAEAGLHLKAVVPDDYNGAQPRHDEDVVDEDDQRGRGGGGDEGGAGGQRRDQHRQPRPAIHPAQPRHQTLVDLRSGVEGLLPRIHEDEDVVGADGQHNVDGQHLLEGHPFDLQHTRCEEDCGREGEDLLRQRGEGNEQGAEWAEAGMWAGFEDSTNMAAMNTPSPLGGGRPGGGDRRGAHGDGQAQADAGQPVTRPPCKRQLVAGAPLRYPLARHLRPPPGDTSPRTCMSSVLMSTVGSISSHSPVHDRPPTQ